MKPKTNYIGRKYINGSITLKVDLPEGWSFKRGRDGILGCYDPKTGELELYVRRPITNVESTLTTMGGKQLLLETLEKPEAS